jgi:hypothetical protein
MRKNISSGACWKDPVGHSKAVRAGNGSEGMGNIADSQMIKSANWFSHLL